MTQKNAQSGFTLIEMAFVLLIMGLIVGSVFAFYSPQLEQKRIQQTLDRQKKIAVALSDFAQRTGRLPCPGRPNPTTPPNIKLGDPNNWTAAQPDGLTTSCGAGNPANFVGIVPFRSLGLTQDDATDGFGNPFTYAVNQLAQTPAASTVNENCRGVNNGTWRTTVNRNVPKARLCCQQMTTTLANTLMIFDDVAMGVADRIVTTQTDAPPSGARFGNPDTAGTFLVTDNLRYFAYVLVSHGKNGERSYVFDQTARKTAVSAGTGETENADDDSSFVTVPRSEDVGNVNTYFDDIVLWRTQQAMMADVGNSSCALP